MTIEEVFTKMASHILDGVMIHEQLVHYHNFLHLPGYAAFHTERCLEESAGYMRLYKYYINHYGKLIPNVRVVQTDVIPKTWYSHSKKDIDSSTFRSSVKSGLEMWVKWEKETQKLYQELYAELIKLGEIASAKFISEYICDVTNELSEAERYYLNKKIRDYDINDIMDEQEKFRDSHCKKLCKIIKDNSNKD